MYQATTIYIKQKKTNFSNVLVYFPLTGEIRILRK